MQKFIYKIPPAFILGITMTKIKSKLLLPLLAVGILSVSLSGFVISQAPRNSVQEPNKIDDLKGLSMVWLGNSHLSDQIIDSLNTMLLSSDADALHVLKELTKVDVRDALFVDGYWLGTANNADLIRDYLVKLKPVIIIGGNRTVIATIILTKLEDLLSSMAMKDLHNYVENPEPPREEAVAAIIIWPVKGGLARTLQLVMAGQPENDKHAIDELIRNILQVIASNWRR